MGAAEYEWGVFPKCIKMMKHMGTEHLEFGNGHLGGDVHYNIHGIRIYIVTAKGCNLYKVKPIIDYLYFATSLNLHNTGHFLKYLRMIMVRFIKQYHVV